MAMENANLFTLFDVRVTARPDVPALIPDKGSPWSYADLRAAAGRYARLLRSRGVEPGDRVVVQISKSVEGVALYLGCLQAGAVFVPLNTAYTDAEVGYFLDDCRPALFVHDAARTFEHPAAAAIDGADGLAEQAQALEPASEIARREGGDLAAICYTSGTTGRSKGAMITHDNLASNANTLIDLWRFTSDDVLLHILPIFHVHGLFVAIHCALLSGAAMLFERTFDADRAIGLLPRASVMMGVPTHYTRLLQQDGMTREACAGMRLFISGSAPLLAETHREFEARSAHAILERYGMSEAGMIISNPYEGERVPGTVGFPLPGVEARIGGDDGVLIEKAGEIGTLQICGPNVFSGYWEMPEKTAESFTEDGWFITGDLVSRDEEGRYTIVGRAKDLIISGGYNIYPKEIEGVLDEAEGISESAVIGLADADFGEKVVAVIVPSSDARPSEEALQALVTEQLARFKHPREYHFVEALPRNAMGKVQKAELRELLG